MLTARSRKPSALPLPLNLTFEGGVDCTPRALTPKQKIQPAQTSLSQTSTCSTHLPQTLPNNLPPTLHPQILPPPHHPTPPLKSGVMMLSLLATPKPPSPKLPPATTPTYKPPPPTRHSYPKAPTSSTSTKTPSSAKISQSSTPTNKQSPTP